MDMAGGGGDLPVVDENNAMETYPTLNTPHESLVPTPTEHGTVASGELLDKWPTLSPTASNWPSPSAGWTYDPTVTAMPSPVEGWADTLEPTVYIPDRKLRGSDQQENAAENTSTGVERREQVSSVPEIATRSVRLLVAGHVETTDKRGYIVGQLPDGQFDESKVYAFAQQVDMRLPAGPIDSAKANGDTKNIMQEFYDKLESYNPPDQSFNGDMGSVHGVASYELGLHGMSEEELAQTLPSDWKLDVPHEDFAKIVTSGVESRALLNDAVQPGIRSIYPVSLVADPTSKSHYYVVLLASDSDVLNVQEVKKYSHTDETIGEGATQRSWTDYSTKDLDRDEQDTFGPRNRPNYGSDFRVIVKKMTIEANVDEAELTDTEKVLGNQAYDSGGLITMRHDWFQEFEPDLGEDVRPAGLLFAPSGDANGKGDVLVMVGTTAGRGNAFGTVSSGVSGADSVGTHLNGFISKIRVEDGNFAGKATFNAATNTFTNVHSLQITSNPGKNDMVAGVCATPLRKHGPQQEMTHIYVVGSTGAVLPAVKQGVRSAEFLSEYPVPNGSEIMEAYLMKVSLSTMEIVWTAQIGGFVPGAGERVNALGYGCAVTFDSEDVYLTGVVKHFGAATDFSDIGVGGDLFHKAAGSTDVFVASFSASDGTRRFIKQVGSDRDDFPSRGNGGITTDRSGNAILVGNTRGSMLRQRGVDEFRYGKDGDDAAADVFVMSFSREDGAHVLPMHMRGKVPTEPEPVTPPVSQPEPAAPQPAAPIPDIADIDPAPPEYGNTPIYGAGGEEEVTNTKSSKVEAVALVMTFILIIAIGYGFMVHRVKQNKEREKKALMETNLRDRGDVSMPGRRRSTWMNRRSSSNMEDFNAFNDLNIMVEVRNSASGGWHGVYDDEQLQAIDFGTPSSSGLAGDDDTQDVVEQSLFMEDGLKEIEDGLENYEIGEMDDVSDEDLIKAYNDAMALDIEPENPDIEFAMAGIGSGGIYDEAGINIHDEDKQIT
jgi:hypothetical protein